MRFWVAVEVEAAVVVADTKETTPTMIARRGMTEVAVEEEVDAVDIAVVVVEEGVTRGIGRAITLMIIVRGRLVVDVVWIGYGKDAMIRI